MGVQDQILYLSSLTSIQYQQFLEPYFKHFLSMCEIYR